MKKRVLILISFLFINIASAQQITPYVGEIRIFAGNFAPAGWAICDGSTLSRSENEILFQVIGTIYGGDGINTFKLPDFRSRVPIGSGQGATAKNVALGEKEGKETLILTENNLPAHTHLTQLAVSSQNATLKTPVANSSLAKQGVQSGRIFIPALLYNQEVPDMTLTAAVTSSVGESKPISIIKPYQVINYIIALEGRFPSAN